mgnify:CR=1 FL=1
MSIDGTAVRVMIINTGDAPGMFVKAIPESDYLAGATKIKLRDDRSAIIAPGSNLLMFDIMPLLDQNQSYRNSLEMLQLIIQQKEPPRQT